MSNTTGELYPGQEAAYAGFADDSFSWKYIERPGFDTYVGDFYRPETRVLDIGCGTGRIVRHLLSQGVSSENCVGLDPNGAMLEHAKARNPEVSFVQANAQDNVFTNNSFDLVTSNMVLGSMDATDLALTLAASHRTLKPGGVFFFITPSPNVANQGEWTTTSTPWNTEARAFNHDIGTLLDETAHLAGFAVTKSSILPVSEAGRSDAAEYERYAKPAHFRVAARLEKQD